MDAKAIRRAALITLQQAILKRFRRDLSAANGCGVRYVRGDAGRARLLEMHLKRMQQRQ